MLDCMTGLLSLLTFPMPLPLLYSLIHKRQPLLQTKTMVYISTHFYNAFPSTKNMFPLLKLWGTHPVYVLWNCAPTSSRNETLCHLHPGDERGEPPGLFLADGLDDNDRMSDSDKRPDLDSELDDHV